jgi:carbon storage regulator
MLILTRKEGELISIGSDVVVEVVAIGSSGVRIGISAPKDVEVHREEVRQRIPTSAAVPAVV